MTFKEILEQTGEAAAAVGRKDSGGMTAKEYLGQIRKGEGGETIGR